MNLGLPTPLSSVPPSVEHNIRSGFTGQMSLCVRYHDIITAATLVTTNIGIPVKDETRGTDLSHMTTTAKITRERSISDPSQMVRNMAHTIN